MRHVDTRLLRTVRLPLPVDGRPERLSSHLLPQSSPLRGEVQDADRRRADGLHRAKGKEYS